MNYAKHTKTRWTDEELAVLKEHWLKPDGVKIVQELLPHRHYNSIKATALNRGLKRWIQYTKDEGFFDTLNDTSNVIAGFVAADGCISEERRSFVITISAKDKDYLEKIRCHVKHSGELIEGSRPAGHIIVSRGKEYVQKETHHVTLLVSDCARWIESLQKTWNITPRKSHTLQPPNLTNLRHILCYQSGLIDGDGWVCLNKKIDSKHGKILEISVMGTQELMTWVKKTFDYITPGEDEAQVKTNTSNNYTYSVKGMRAYVMAKVFLSLDILRLDRKWDLARNYIALLEAPGGMSPKMTTYLKKTGFDPTLINRLQTEEILLPAVPNA